MTEETKKIELGIEIEPLVDYPVIKETLERMGIKNANKKIFCPSCYCVKNEDTGKYFIYHFKEFFIMDNLESTINKVDIYRRNTIAYLLSEWKLLKLVCDVKDITILKEHIDIIPKEQKKDYRILHKYKFNRRVKVENLNKE